MTSSLARAAQLALVAALAAAAVACGPKPGVRGASAGDAVLVFEANVPQAGMWIDGVFIGGLDTMRGGVALSPGPHRIEIRHDDYFTYYRELTVTAGEKQRIAVELAPTLP